MSAPRPVDVATCTVCGQPTLLLFLAPSWSGPVMVGHCGECDAGHCPRCGRHTPTRRLERFCTECGTSLALPAAG